MASGVHKRKGRDGAKTQEFSSDCATDCKDVTVDKDEKPSTEAKLEAGSYWLTRIVFIRALGFVYFAAFLVALDQNKGLMGKNGLLPIPSYLAMLRDHFMVPANRSTTFTAVSAVPTLLWWVPAEDTDVALDCIASAGLALSAVLVIAGGGNVVIFTILWALYHSLVNIGQRWYSFGWESQLLETGFLAIFLSPILSLRQLPKLTPTPWSVVWGYRWLVFRLMLGAGLIKIRGDQCWRDLTCMNYHYQTQPIPNPLSYYLHQTPEPLHKIETLTNHVVELACPFLLLLPRPLGSVGGLIQILFQVILIISGNLSFLNWLTIAPAIICFDDKSLCWLFPSSARKRVIELQQYWKNTKTKPFSYYVRQASSLALAALITYLSIPVVQNLFSSRQVMNTSFGSLRIVNTYGHFGSVTKERTEVILEGTYNSSLGRNGEAADWLEIEFKCKPGATNRPPCIISPYHYRLDWLMWFAAFQNYQHNPWLLHLAGKILAGDPSVNSLLAHNPFIKKPPKYMRALHYQYQYTEVGSEAAAKGEWWSRKLIGQLYMPIVSAEQLRPVIEAQGWKWYEPDQTLK